MTQSVGDLATRCNCIHPALLHHVDKGRPALGCAECACRGFAPRQESEAVHGAVVHFRRLAPIEPASVELERIYAARYIAAAARAYRRFPSELNKWVLFARIAEVDGEDAGITHE